MSRKARAPGCATMAARMTCLRPWTTPASRIAFEKLGKADHKRLATEAAPFGEHVQFPGFDGNNESEHLGIARFLINDLDRFSRFREGHRDLNSHFPALEGYGRMLQVFEPIRKTLVGRGLSVDELVSILNSRRAS
jgi:uncharacterized protein YfbU (UPF0304 family)